VGSGDAGVAEYRQRALYVEVEGVAVEDVHLMGVEPCHSARVGPLGAALAPCADRVAHGVPLGVGIVVSHAMCASGDRAALSDGVVGAATCITEPLYSPPRFGGVGGPRDQHAADLRG